MKKLLVLLTGTLGLTVGTVANIFNSSQTVENINLNKEQSGIHWVESKDTVSYDVTKPGSGNVLSFDLPDLLSLFTSLNNLHKEKNVTVLPYGFPQFTFELNGHLVGFGHADMSTENIASLINSDYVKLTNASVRIIAINTASFTAFLDYEISDIKQSLNLFDFYKSDFPKKVDGLTIKYNLSYEY